MARIVIDLDETLTVDASSPEYAHKAVNHPVVERLRSFKEQGFEIVIYSSRNMRTYNGSVGKITANTVPIIVAWLKANNVPFDELHVGKPWCGDGGFYVDDKTIRPDEFTRLSYEEIMTLIGSRSPG
jgi:capsule biosynthesis phosphatase